LIFAQALAATAAQKAPAREYHLVVKETKRLEARVAVLESQLAANTTAK
jgi:hypothetical protein